VKYHILVLLCLSMGLPVGGCVPMERMNDQHVCRDSCTKGGAVTFASCCLERENFTCTKRGTLSSQDWYCSRCGKWCASESTACQ